MSIDLNIELGAVKGQLENDIEKLDYALKHNMSQDEVILQFKILHCIIEGYKKYDELIELGHKEKKVDKGLIRIFKEFREEQQLW